MICEGDKNRGRININLIGDQDKCQQERGYQAVETVIVVLVCLFCRHELIKEFEQEEKEQQSVTRSKMVEEFTQLSSENVSVGLSLQELVISEPVLCLHNVTFRHTTKTLV